MILWIIKETLKIFSQVIRLLVANEQALDYSCYNFCRSYKSTKQIKLDRKKLPCIIHPNTDFLEFQIKMGFKFQFEESLRVFPSLLRVNFEEIISVSENRIHKSRMLTTNNGIPGLNPLMDNDPKSSNTLKKSLIECCKILK